MQSTMVRGPARQLRPVRRVIGHSCAALVMVALLGACDSSATPTTRAPDPVHAAPEAAAVAPGPQVRFERAGEGDVAMLVRAFVAAARAEGRTPIVYVGASWCEPCGYFHAAATRGDLDHDLPPLSLLEFDLDVDAARLATAGYSSQMIPLFAVPSEDGRASERRIEGSIHGAGSPAEIAPRLRAILSAP
jgi:hypothetical protein